MPSGSKRSSETDEPQEADKDKGYDEEQWASPEIEVFGDIREITQGQGTKSTDGMTGSPLL